VTPGVGAASLKIDFLIPDLKQIGQLTSRVAPKVLPTAIFLHQLSDKNGST